MVFLRFGEHGPINHGSAGRNPVASKDVILCQTRKNGETLRPSPVDLGKLNRLCELQFDAEMVCQETPMKSGRTGLNDASTRINPVIEDQVRQQVIEMLPEFGFASTEPNWETRLISDGRYLGRRFEFDGIQVYWLRSRHMIEFYNHDWVLLGERKIEQLASVA